MDVIFEMYCTAVSAVKSLAFLESNVFSLDPVTLEEEPKSNDTERLSCVTALRQRVYPFESSSAHIFAGEAY